VANALLNTWYNTGGISFLEMNALAEDLRLLHDKSGFGFVLHDLRDDRLCLPTWHMIHTAALFERARRNAVLEFIEAKDKEAPDFVVEIGGAFVPVEAKLLMQSKQELLFSSVASRIEESMMAADALPAQTSALLVMKQPVTADIAEAATDWLRQGVQRYRGTPLSGKSSLCNVFLEPITAPPGMSDYRTIYIMAPVPEVENMRALKRAKQASRQLRSLPSVRDSGILALGLTDNQDGRAVFEHIANRIKLGRFAGISAVLLLKRRTDVGPPRRGTVDLLEIRKNAGANQPLQGKVPLRPLDMAGLLSNTEPLIGGIRAFRFGTTSARVVDPTRPAALVLPDLRALTPEMLQ
jgi:hypothetical protein